MDSNFRGFTSASGIFSPNACSRAPIMSTSANESTTPASNNDSSSGGRSDLAIDFTMATILSRLFMRDLRSNLQELVVDCHEITNEGAPEELISGSSPHTY